MRCLVCVFGLLGLLLAHCGKDDPQPAAEVYTLPIPPGFPTPEVPADNALTPERIALGKRLFYDPALSRDSTLSCASCHKQALAFADNRATSPGIQDRPGTRNAPTLANVAYQKRLLREGGVPTLEMQILVPIQEHNEFDFNILDIAERLRRMPEYVDLAWQTYGRKPDAFVITRAIAAFERSLFSGDSAFDRWYFQGNPFAAPPAARRGYALFNSERLGCGQCHSGFLFTNQEYANNGLYEQYTDPGRMRLTGRENDRAVFKIPSLRNVGVTAPYMHDGSLATLEQVIDHYQSGGKSHPNKSPLLQPFSLSPEERQDVLAFLNSLTDYSFLQNPQFR